MKPPRNRSLQTIHKLRQQEIFLGREQQEDFFQKNLMLDEELRIYIFNIFGQGGVGKSSLLRRFSQIAENANALTIWNDEIQKDMLAVLESITKQLEKQGHVLKKFSKTYQTYLQRCQELATDPDAPSGLADFMGDLAKIGFRIGRHIPAGVVLDLVGEETIAEGASSFANSFITHLRRKLSNEEANLVQRPIEVLTRCFLEDLWDVAEKQVVAFFFDTYEYTRAYLEDWLLECLDGYYGEMSANIILAIAGRDELDRNHWEKFEGILTHIPLEPLTEEDARKYLSRKGILEEQVIKVILQLSGCLPLLLATLSAEHPTDPSQVGDPSGTAVDRFLKWVEDPQHRQVAIDAALPRQLNRDVLAVLTAEQDADVNRLFAWLKKMPFLMEHSTGWKYHDVVRPQMIHHKYIEAPQEWSDLHGQLADYYKKCQDNLGLDEHRRMVDTTWRGFALEELYHRLCQAPHTNLSKALNGFLATYGYAINEAFPYRWVETIQQAGEDSNVAFVRDWGELLSKGLKYDKEGRFQDTIEMFSELLKNADLEARWYYKALLRRANLYLNTKQYQKALSDINMYNEFYPEDVRGLLLKVIICINLGDNDQAQTVFQRIAELDPKFLLDLLEGIRKILPELEAIADKEEVTIGENNSSNTDS